MYRQYGDVEQWRFPDSSVITQCTSLALRVSRRFTVLPHYQRLNTAHMCATIYTCGQICEFKNLSKIIIIILALLMKNVNSRILNFVASPKIRNSRQFKHVNITRSTVLFFCYNLFFLMIYSIYLYTLPYCSINLTIIRDFLFYCHDNVNSITGHQIS